VSTVLLVMRRELTEKIRSKAFWIMNGVIVVLVLAATIIPVLLSDGGIDQIEVAGVGSDANAILTLAAQQAPVFGIELVISELPDDDTARAAVEAGEVELALLDSAVLVGAARPRGDAFALIDGARRLALLDRALSDAGVPDADRTTLLATPPLTVESLSVEADDVDPVALGIGLLAVSLLYGLLIFYGQQVAQGIVQEKQSRVIEVLLATMRPVQLLGGKLLGLGVLGLAQVAAIGLAGYIGLLVTGQDTVPAAAVPTVLSAIVWFVLGFGLYASMFALAAAVVAKIEDLQTAMMAPIIALVGSVVLVQFAVADPDGTMATVAALLPTSAPIAQPLRIALGTSSTAITLLGALSVLTTTAVIVPLAARVHAGAALSVRQRISVREALRRARA
jgi:ABC-2 type transport system permease protein